MRIAVTGSIATDQLMTFPGRFSEQLVADQLDRVSLSFLVDELEVRRGGVTANILYGLAQLGLTPVLVGAVGQDFDGDYRAWLSRHGVDISGIHVSELEHTARLSCTTDLDQNQMASFYTGAMEEARFIELAPLAERHGALDLVVISPNDPGAMLRHTAECRQLGLPFMAGLSWQVSLERAAQIGSMAATDVLEHVGTQEYDLDAEGFLARVGDVYGEAAAAELTPHLAVD